MIRAVNFDVALVRGKGRVRFVRQTGRTYTPDATAEAMEQVRAAYVVRAQGTMAPKGAPVMVEIDTFRPLPKSRPKKVTHEPDVFKPDADNVAKLVLDALNGTAWHDDTQVTDLEVHKHERSRVCDGDLMHVEVSWPTGGDYIGEEKK
jgi:Holliday junction resolvase RusA-like endonuclease